ncbi:tetratricopeptide repeat protein, partial [Bathymodiolus thermophilus thioautotrophic gill symbiont]
KHKKAIEYFELALKSDLKTYGEDHPEVAISRNNLGTAWKSLGKYKKAIGYYELALVALEKTLGIEHPT